MKMCRWGVHVDGRVAGVSGVTWSVRERSGSSLAR
jgi:hypothetical protein